MAKRKVSERVASGLEEALAHAQGPSVSGLVEHIPDEIDVKAIRKRTKLSQPLFAKMIAVNVSTLRNWEQGRRQPEGPARVLLTLVDKNPHIVEHTLTGR